jgi:hypothetical protein
MAKNGGQVGTGRPGEVRLLPENGDNRISKLLFL